MKLLLGIYWFLKDFQEYYQDMAAGEAAIAIWLLLFCGLILFFVHRKLRR